MAIVLKKRGRPSKADILARQTTKMIKRTDAEILTDLKERFGILTTLTKGAVAKNVRAVTVTGAPGVGKTYTVEQVLETAKKQKNTSFEIIKGAISAVNLYKAAYRNRKPGSVIVLDDADSIFNDEDALNILKVLCDSSEVRRVSWLKESHTLAQDDVPQTFEFNGAMIVVSNIDFAKFVAEGKNKYAAHMQALMSRSLYLDLQIHDRNTLGVWVEHLAADGRIFDVDEVPMQCRADILKFLKDNRENLYELSIRTLKKLNQLVSINPKNWNGMAKVLLCKNV